MTDSIADFLAKHIKPYDPATDTYRRPPFAEPVRAGKNSAIYNAHSYHTKVPPEGIVPYIEHYTDPGDLVLDPFCGSGMTGVAGLMCGRAVILNDLSPAAVHITRNYTTPVDVQLLKREFERIKSETHSEFSWLYGTSCDRCGGPASILHTLWSDVFECGRCGKDLVLFDVAFSPETRILNKQFVCPDCKKEWNKAQLKRIRTQPIITSYECKGTCKPKRQEHRISDAELSLITEIEEKNIPYWHPTVELNSNMEMYIRGSLHLRNIKTVDQLFTKRNLWAMARLWDEIQKVENDQVLERLRATFTATCQLVSRMRRYRLGGFGGNIMSGLIYLPALNLDVSVPKLWQTKFDDILSAALQLNRFVKPGWAQTNIGSATDLKSIPNNTLDYVFTDPPFGMNLYYSDLNVLWESWLNTFTDSTFEAVVHREQKVLAKSVNDYAVLMEKAFREMYRVLKPTRWASVVFHNSDDKIWQVIINAAAASGFEIAEINAFDKVQLSFKGVKGQKGEERVTNKDIVLNLRKPRPSDTTSSNGRTHLAEAEQRVLETVAGFLKTNPVPAERTLQHIWNHVLYGMIRDGSVQVSMAGLEEMLAYHYQTFKMVDGRYYLRGEAVVGGNVFSLQTDTDALTWLSSVLASQPLTTGELIPLWQRETAHLGGVDAGRLDRLLEQNFWQDKKTGRWRNPTTEEREKMNAQVDLSAQAHLRVVRRYLDGGLDHRPDDRELTAWIRFCYSREFYEEAATLFERINEAILDPEEYKTIKKMAAVAKLKKK